MNSYYNGGSEVIFKAEIYQKQNDNPNEQNRAIERQQLS